MRRSRAPGDRQYTFRFFNRMTQYWAMRLRENSLGNDSCWLPGGGTASSSTSCCVRLRACQRDVNVQLAAEVARPTPAGTAGNWAASSITLG